MALELEAPAATEQPEVRLFAEPHEATQAAALLESMDEAAREFSAEPQRDGSTAVTVRLTRDVVDSTSAFSGHADETYDGYVDEDGNTWIPLPAGDICLEAEEFEIVQPLPEEVAEIALEAVAADPMPPAVETPPAAATEPAAAVPTPPAAPKPQPSEYEVRRRQYLREKDVLQEQISALMIEQAKLKEQVKKCKKEAEVYCEQLSELIDNWENTAATLENEPPTPAGSAADVTATTPATESLTAADKPSVEPAAEPAIDSEQAARVAEINSQAAEQARYQRVLEAAPIGQLGLPAKVQERLEEAGATTIWRLEQLRAEIAQGREKWPKGIGEAKITQIEDAIISWMGRNSETWSKGYRDAIAEETAAEAVKEPQAAGPAVSNDIDDL